jgi:hypothetical protein
MPGTGKRLSQTLAVHSCPSKFSEFSPRNTIVGSSFENESSKFILEKKKKKLSILQALGSKCGMRKPPCFEPLQCSTQARKK